MEEKTITLYPSNWLYNAGVIGFLRIIASREGEKKVESWLNDDSSVSIDTKLFENIVVGNEPIPQCLKYYFEYVTDSLIGTKNASTEEYFQKWLNSKDNKGKTYQQKYQEFADVWGELGYKIAFSGGRLFSSMGIYTNFVQIPNSKTFILEIKEFSKFINSLKNYSSFNSDILCGLCNSNKTKKPDPENKFENRCLNFNHPLLTYLAPSKVFPNAFWNMDHSFYICPLCVYLIIHHHIPFEKAKTEDGQIFINAPSFKVMWYLNKFVSEVLKKRHELDIRRLFGISLIQYALKVQANLGAWTLMNIEMVIKKGDSIDYYYLPFDIARLLVNPKIASLIEQSKEPIVLELVLNGNFDKLLSLSDEILRVQFAATKPVSNKGRLLHLLKDKKNMHKLPSILTELYAKIEKILKER